MTWPLAYTTACTSVQAVIDDGNDDDDDVDDDDDSVKFNNVSKLEITRTQDSDVGSPSYADPNRNSRARLSGRKIWVHISVGIPYNKQNK